ncbi:hypothetical protein F751_5510 [Auxenochlorella protothecoides]|uniref:ShKT domain-containing protein n=1 Tax=Auxenochlorella protothecoides TaxID=3075 RepID=A0A087STV0_AUXPR|nr:hypothetical protein F751_5510 [Auxenochlorella protothecoides]KFM29154.1 hypothetical protein F751_5510 [Auxenochlorella protothecoides]
MLPSAPPLRHSLPGRPRPAACCPDLRRQLEEYLGHVEGAVSAEGALDTNAALDADDSLALDQSCVDRHPQCELWAAKGECRANPVYMIGKGGAVAQCARACATCTRPAPSLPAFLLGAAEPARAQEAAREAARLGQASLVRGGLVQSQVMLVRGAKDPEPVQCEYLIELYVPELCPVFDEGAGDGGEEVVEEEGGVVVILGEDGALPQREGGAEPEQAAEAEEAEDVMDSTAWDEL